MLGAPGSNPQWGPVVISKVLHTLPFPHVKTGHSIRPSSFSKTSMGVLVIWKSSAFLSFVALVFILLYLCPLFPWCLYRKGKAISCTGLDRHRGFRGLLRLVDFKMLRTWRWKRSFLSTIHLYPPKEIFLVLISVRGWVDPRASVQPEGLVQRKLPITPSGIKPASFQLLAQYLKHLCSPVPSLLRQHTEHFDVAVKFWTRISKIPGLNLGWDTGCPRCNIT